MCVIGWAKSGNVYVSVSKMVVILIWSKWGEMCVHKLVLSHYNVGYVGKKFVG